MNVTAVEQRLDGIGELRKGQEWAPFGSETWSDFQHMKCPSKQGRLSRVGIKKRYEQDEWGKCKAWGSHKNVFQACEPYNQPPKVPSGAAMPSLTPLTWGKKCGPWVSCLGVGEKNVNFFWCGNQQGQYGLLDVCIFCHSQTQWSARQAPFLDITSRPWVLVCRRSHPNIPGRP